MATTEKIYLALNEDLTAHICRAFSKKQMKVAGMNMKLEWQRMEDIEQAMQYIQYDGHTLKSDTDVTNFTYS